MGVVWKGERRRMRGSVRGNIAYRQKEGTLAYIGGMSYYILFMARRRGRNAAAAADGPWT